MKVLAACGTPVLIDPEDLGVFESYVWRVYRYGRNHRYVTTTDPLPAGWVVLTDPTYHYSMTLCPKCYADRAERLIHDLT